MSKLANLALGGILAASLAMGGGAGYVTGHHHTRPRPRIIYHEPTCEAPILIVCSDWPSRDHYCHHTHCYDRYIVELRHKYDQSNVRPFEYSPQRQAFPHESKVERRGSKTEAIVKEKSKESKRAFPKPAQQDNSSAKSKSGN